MTRVWLAVLVVLVLTAIGFGVWDEIDARTTHERVQQSRAHWTMVVDANAPIGATKDQVDIWVRRTFPGPEKAYVEPFSPERRAFDVVAEIIPVNGLKFPCSAWAIQLEIDLGTDDRVMDRKVRTSGVCT